MTKIHELFEGWDSEVLKDFDGTILFPYELKSAAWFCEVDGEWGGFSNMACKDAATKSPRFPLWVASKSVLCSEHLYQALRYPHLPNRQVEILAEKSPMSAKMKARRKKDEESRADFEEIRDALMWWTLRVKLACNPVKFGELLKRSGDKPIVEVTNKPHPRPGDLHWGTKRSEDGLTTTGSNVLGRQLMLLREVVKTRPESDWRYVPPVMVENFKLMGNDIGPVDSRHVAAG